MQLKTIRLKTVVRCHWDAKQWKNQTVKNYATYLNELEEQLESFTDTQQQDHFVTGLQTDIASALAERLDQLTTHQDAIKLATCIKKSWEIWNQNPQPATHTDNKSDKKQKDETHSKSQNVLDKSVTTDTAPPQTKGKVSKKIKRFKNPNKQPLESIMNVTCYACNKQGHYASSCSDKAKPEGGTAHAILCVMKGLHHLMMQIRLKTATGQKDLFTMADSGSDFNFILQ